MLQERPNFGLKKMEKWLREPNFVIHEQCQCLQWQACVGLKWAKLLKACTEEGSMMQKAQRVAHFEQERMQVRDNVQA